MAKPKQQSKRSTGNLGKHVVVIARPPNSNWARVMAGNLKSQSDDGTRVVLTGARQALYYAAETGGELGLAAFGPRGESRVSARIAEVEVLGVGLVAPTTDEAEKAWLNFAVWGGK